MNLHRGAGSTGFVGATGEVAVPMPEDPTDSAGVEALRTVHLDDCDTLLPRDRTCQTVRFTQFLLPGCLEAAAGSAASGQTGDKLSGRYYSIQPQYAGKRPEDEPNESELKKDLGRRYAAFRKTLPTAAAVEKGPSQIPKREPMTSMRCAPSSADGILLGST